MDRKEPCRRRTAIAHSRLAMRELRLDAARGSRHGLQVMTFEQLAARLAGGFSRPIDDDALREAIGSVLPDTELGELDGIKALPGMVNAAADTLRKAWRAGIDLGSRAGEHPRLGSIATLEKAALDALPPAMKPPADLVSAGLGRLDRVPTLFGPIEIVGITELSPVWRPLLHAIAARVNVRWIAGPRPVPPWLDGDAVDIVRTEPNAPQVSAVGAATAYHEAVEAMRWARELVSSGRARPEDIAISSVVPAEYDDHFLALQGDANLDLHFVHGVAVTACRDGQAAAALADILLRGLSQTRMRRLNALLAPHPGPFRELAEGWTSILPPDAPLSSLEAWTRSIEGLTPDDWPGGTDRGPLLLDIVELLSRGTDAAEEAEERLLSGRALRIWRKALLAGPAASLDLNLEALKQDDGIDPCVSVCWMPASALAASPRRFVRLLGLNSSRWPRGIAEDRLLSDHIVPTSELDPLPVASADRRDFETILKTTETEIVLSRARRDNDGRLLGRSALLLDAAPEETYLRRNAIPAHAFSETDRLMARPGEFRTAPQAVSAIGCWHDWHRDGITPHDGLTREDHPAILATLERIQSASSLRLLLRNPLGFVWRYGLNWRAPESGDEARSRRASGPHPASVGAGHRGEAAGAEPPRERHHAARSPVAGGRRSPRPPHPASAPWRPGGAGSGQCRSLSPLQLRLRGARAARLRRSHDRGLDRRGPRGGRQAGRPRGSGRALHHAVWQRALYRWDFRSNLVPATVAAAEEWWPQKLDTNTVWNDGHYFRLFNIGEINSQLGLGIHLDIERVRLSFSLFGKDGTEYTAELDLGDTWPKQELDGEIAWTCNSLAPIRDDGTIDCEPVRKAAEDALAAVAARVRS